MVNFIDVLDLLNLFTQLVVLLTGVSRVHIVPNTIANPPLPRIQHAGLMGAVSTERSMLYSDYLGFYGHPAGESRCPHSYHCLTQPRQQQQQTEYQTHGRLEFNSSYLIFMVPCMQYSKIPHYTDKMWSLYGYASFSSSLAL